MNYPSFNSSTLQPNNQNRGRLRASSASLPLGLDLRTQFRSTGPGQNMQPSSHTPGSRTTSTTTQIGGVSSSYTASFPSAPLTAPIDFGVPRTPGFRSSGTDYSMPQMSAPIAPPNDFSQAFQASMSSSNARTPIRDTFGSGPHQTSEQRTDDYSNDHLGSMKRKQSFPGHSPTSGGATGPYSTAT